MRRTTPRKVLAQRKFAQGAYVPPSAGPQPSTSAAAVAPERRELPLTADRGQNIIHKNVSAKSLLDVLSFTAVSHAKLSPPVVKPSDTPVVMVQRLPERSLQHCREKTASENKVKNRATIASVVNIRANRIARKSRRKVTKLIRHSMRLRSVRRRPKWMQCAPELSNVIKSPKDVKLNKCAPPQPAETVQVAKPIEEPKSPVLKKKKITHKKKTRFTLDDNRPLKYLMKSNGSPNAEDVRLHQSAGTASTSHKEAMEPLADVGMVMRRRKSGMSDIDMAVRRRRKSGIARTSLKEAGEPSVDIEMEVRRRKSAPTMIPLDATKVILEKLPIAVQEEMDTNYKKTGTARTSHRESMETPADTGMTVRRRKSGTKRPSHKEAVEPSADIGIPVRRRKSDFSSQSSAVVQPEVRTELKQAPGVKADARTNSAGLLGASPLEPQVKTVPIASSTPFNYSSAQGIHRWLDGNVLVEHVSEIEDDDDDVIIVLPGDCPSLKWNTINEAAIAPASQFLSRCKVCQPCQRIDKVVRLTALLKRQRKIECLTDEPVAGPSTEPDYSIVKEEHESYTTELLPRHPHLMIKIRVRNANTGQYSACLIPRSEAKGSAVFNLVEKESILDQMIESLSLSLGDAPSKQIGEPVDKSVPCSKQVQEGTEAPTFYPTVAEFQDPFTYIEKIWHRVTRYGLCKIVPPEGFVPTCNIAEEIRFAVSNQYVNRLFKRWGEASKTMGAITACLKRHNVDLKQAQMIQGVETNLVKLMQTVDKNGGIQTVINRKKWTKIAEDMNISKHPHVRRKLEVLYYKALLPFCTLTVEEREEYFKAMDLYWKTTNAKLLKRARNPLYRRNRLLGATDSSSDSDYDMEYEEECVHHTGATMNVAGFKKISGIVYDQLYNTKAVSLKDYERDYWDRVQSGTEHICVNSASIDTGQAGYGFTKNPSDEYSKHPWNLKVLSQNSANMLRPLGAVVGVTVPTLHLGMIFSTSCWHRDPHGLPWIEYLHQGEPKIWYSVPESQDAPFRAATEALCPIAVQNKSIWLPSDIAMIPPAVLRARDVTVCRTEQLAGEFILVMPKAYSCSFSTGYGVSESTYLATRRWLPNLLEIFSEIRESSEPTMFSLEQLLKLTAEDEKTELSVLQIIQPALVKVFTQEIENRQLLLEMGVELQLESTQSLPKEPKAQEDGRATGSEQTSEPTAWNVRDENECEYCRCPLYLSEVRNLPTQGSTVCVEHALLLLRQPKYSTVEVSSLTMVYSYSIEQLRRTLKTVENRLATGGRV